MHIGIRESDARQLVARALADAGLKDWVDLPLFRGMRLLMAPAIPPKNCRPPSRQWYRPPPPPDDFASFDRLLERGHSHTRPTRFHHPRYPSPNMELCPLGSEYRISNRLCRRGRRADFSSA